MTVLSPLLPSWTIESFFKFLEFIAKIIFLLIFVGCLYYDVIVKIIAFQKKKLI